MSLRFFRPVLRPVLRATLALLSLSPLAATASFENECERRLPPTRVDVISYPSEVVYDFSRSVQSLTTKSGLDRKKGEYTLGTTERKMQLQSRWSGDFLTNADTGMACSRPHLTMDLWVGPQIVSVAREFPEGGCAFGEIAKHELRHVYANQTHAETVADLIKVELTRSLGNRVFYGTPAELKDAFTNRLQKEWLKWGMERYDEVRLAHEVIDSPEEYARNTSMCGGEVRTVIQALERR